jgi:hypothetical protein
MPNPSESARGIPPGASVPPPVGRALGWGGAFAVTKRGQILPASEYSWQRGDILVEGR